MVYRVQDIPIAVKRLRERKIFITTGRNRGFSMVFFTIELAIKSPQARSAEDGSVRSILEKEKSTVRSFEQQQVEQRYKWLWKSVCRSVRATSINFYSSLLPFLLSSSLHLASFIETLYSSATINLSSRIYLVEREIMSFHPIIIVIIIQKLLLNKKKYKMEYILYRDVRRTYFVR